MENNCFIPVVKWARKGFARVNVLQTESLDKKDVFKKKSSNSISGKAMDVDSFEENDEEM